MAGWDIIVYLSAGIVYFTVLAVTLGFIKYIKGSKDIISNIEQGEKV